MLGVLNSFHYLCRQQTLQTMNIVELDGYAANPGDMDWQPWREIETEDGNCCSFTVYDRTPEELVVERAAEADIIIINKVRISEEVMAQLPRLKYVGVLATGYNVVDIEAARRRGIVVTNIPAYSTASVAQLVFAHILNISNAVAQHSQSVRGGDWGRCPDFTYTLTPQKEIAGRVMGIIGFGNTGRAVAEIAHAFGMRVVLAPSLRGAGSVRKDLPEYAEQAETLERFFATADIVSLHCPLTDTTRHIINAKTLSQMKPEAIVINTGRGPLVDEEALAEALEQHRITAAGLDVLEEEPPVNGSPLLTACNCYITPHIAWATLEARKRLMEIAINNVKAFLKGTPVNVV